MNDTIKLTVTPDEAQTIINALAQQPYHLVANLIPKVLAQGNAPTEESLPTEEGVAPNGKDTSADAATV